MASARGLSSIKHGTWAPGQAAKESNEGERQTQRERHITLVWARTVSQGSHQPPPRSPTQVQGEEPRPQLSTGECPHMVRQESGIEERNRGMAMFGKCRPPSWGSHGFVGKTRRARKGTEMQKGNQGESQGPGGISRFLWSALESCVVLR